MAKKIAALILVSYLTVFAVFAVVNNFAKIMGLSFYPLGGFAIFFTLIFLYMGRENIESRINRYILLMQIFIPLGFFVFFQNRYLYQGNIEKIPFSPAYIAFYGCIIGFFFS